tara:strand:+ start:1164 stop:1538 length:375 start_codon:yes stop_codon:yes gene_type:complete
MNLFSDQIEDIRTTTVLNLQESVGLDVEGAELHHELFNIDYFIVGTQRAKKWLGAETLAAVGKIHQYETDNFGEVNTDLSDPEKVVNMLVYILGEELLSESETLQNKWDERLTQEDLDQITKEI